MRFGRQVQGFNSNEPKTISYSGTQAKARASFSCYQIYPVNYTYFGIHTESSMLYCETKLLSKGQVVENIYILPQSLLLRFNLCYKKMLSENHVSDFFGVHPKKPVSPHARINLHPSFFPASGLLLLILEALSGTFCKKIMFLSSCCLI